MTEDDARTKWCPFARVIAPITAPGMDMSWATGNRVSIPDALGTVSSGEPMSPPAAACIGSACMAWRGRETADFKGRADIAFRLNGVTMKPLPRDIEGFCGLAGSPA